MDSLLLTIIEQRFNSVKTDNLIQANELLKNYNYTIHIEKFNELMGTDATENTDEITNRILEIFEQSLYDVLVTLFVVSDTTSFNSVYPLLGLMYRLENYLDHQVVLDEIDDMEYVNSPRETLIHLLEKLFDEDWGWLNTTIHEVRETLITLLTNLHKKAIEVESVDIPDNVLETRTTQNWRFFTMYPNTIIGNFIGQGILPVPVEADMALGTVTNALYNLEDNKQIALEILALAFITPVQLNSIPAQAKIITNKLYVDVNTVTQISLEIDRIVRDGGLLRGQ